MTTPERLEEIRRLPPSHFDSDNERLLVRELTGYVDSLQEQLDAARKERDEARAELQGQVAIAENLVAEIREWMRETGEMLPREVDTAYIHLVGALPPEKPTPTEGTE